MGSTDGGISGYKSETEHNADIEELGLRFQYGCQMDKLPQSCYSLGLWYDNYKEQADKAMDVFKMNCERYKHAESCMKYANGLFYGRGVIKNENAAFKIYKRNCIEHDHQTSCYAAGIFRAYAISSHQEDPDEALMYFDKGCRLKFSSACFQSGLIRMQKDEPKNWKEIAKYWTNACDLGHYRGCVNLAIMHRNGNHFPVNNDEFKRLIDKAEESLRNNVPMVHGEMSDNESSEPA